MAFTIGIKTTNCRTEGPNIASRCLPVGLLKYMDYIYVLKVRICVYIHTTTRFRILLYILEVILRSVIIIPIIDIYIGNNACWEHVTTLW